MSTLLESVFVGVLAFVAYWIGYCVAHRHYKEHGLLHTHACLYYDDSEKDEFPGLYLEIRDQKEFLNLSDHDFVTLELVRGRIGSRDKQSL